MNTCTLKSVFEAIVRLRGYDPATASLSTGDKAKIGQQINDRLSEIWHDAPWPQLMRIEQRHYREDYDATFTYGDGEEVWAEDVNGDGNYYVSLQGGNINHDPTLTASAAWWAAVGDDFVRTIPFVQTGQTQILSVDLANCIYDQDPRVAPETQALERIRIHTDSDYLNYILVGTDEAPLEPWVKFKPICPEFSLTAWDAATNYAIGDLVYLATYGTETIGETFKCLAPCVNQNPYTETTYWEPVVFPADFKSFVVFGVNADQLREDEGRYREEAKAQGEMEKLRTRFLEAQNARRRVLFRGR